MRSLMRRYLFLFVFLLTTATFSQSITFCEGVTEKGAPIKASEVFSISANGSYFYFLVKLPYTVSCEKVSFEIYRIEEDYESYETTISMDTKPDWAWFYKQVTFYQSGWFRVYVRDCSETVLTSGVVQVKFK